MSSNKTFKRIQALKETYKIERDTQEINNKIPELSKHLNLISDYLDRKLTAEEKRRLIFGNFSGVIALLKNDLNFPRADNETIIKLHGKDIKPIKQSFNNLLQVGLIQSDFDITNNSIKLSNECLNRIDRAHTYYINSEKGQITNDNFKKIADAIEILLDSEAITQNRADEIRKGCGRFLEPKRLKSGKSGSAVDYKYIHSIK